MKEEITAAVLFISKLVRRSTSLSEESVDKFELRLQELLSDRFSTHWHPNQPWRGQGYRCLRVNENLRREPTIERAARDCGLNYESLNLPVELTIWVDPEEVCCRFGEHKGSFCTVASFKDGNKENNIEKFDFEKIERPKSTPSGMFKPLGVLKERSFNSCRNASPPSSTQSTPTRKKSFSPPHSVYSAKTHNSPGRSNGTSSPGRVGVGMRENRMLENCFHFGSGHHHSHISHYANGGYTQPFYKTQSWLNLSQTPPPPPPATQLPLFSSAGFIYPPASTPHYTHSHSRSPHYARSPPNMGSQKFKWNSSSYLRNDRHQWFGQRAPLARV
ncbi:BTG [Halocaridina rubra]|uniref:BTG n=1 Tax=Halocaridina rubra TaxID=373956 RepID=A0AAN9A688_HALRR